MNPAQHPKVIAAASMRILVRIANDQPPSAVSAGHVAAQKIIQDISATWQEIARSQRRKASQCETKQAVFSRQSLVVDVGFPRRNGRDWFVFARNGFALC